MIWFCNIGSPTSWRTPNPPISTKFVHLVELMDRSWSSTTRLLLRSPGIHRRNAFASFATVFHLMGCDGREANGTDPVTYPRWERSPRGVYRVYRRSCVCGTELADDSTSLPNHQSQHDGEFHQLQYGRERVSSPQGVARNREFGERDGGFGPVLGRRKQERQLLSDHHGHVRHEQGVVAAGDDGSRAPCLGRRKCGDFIPVELGRGCYVARGCVEDRCWWRAIPSSHTCFAPSFRTRWEWGEWWRKGESA